MYYELALMSVLIAGGYWGWYFVRHDQTRTYGLMQLGAAALSGLGLLGRKLDESSLGIPGAIGVGAGVCLLFVGPMVRGFARRMAAAERFSIAERLLDVADLLAPGSGVGDEKALLGAMREIRDGKIEHTLDALNAAKDRAPAEARLAIDERIAMLYLAAYRWDEAIAHAEQHLFGAVPPVSTPEGGPPQVALRRALGVAPPVFVELLGAYGYKGDLEQAARMLARLEDVCAGRDDAAMWIHRGRLIFLALAGRVGAVESYVEPRRSRHMSPAARTYWIAVAHERHGDGAAAQAAYARARSRSRGRPRLLIDQAIARLPNVRGIELGAAANELVARVEAAPPPSVARPNQPSRPWMTRSLVAVLIAASLVINLAFGDSTDVGVLIRSGAMVRGLIDGGEWWRLVSCVFVHVGVGHLVLNLIGLWFIGRIAEDLFGPARTLAIFAVAAIGGSVASFLASPAGVSAGASGAIFGLLGAVFVELTWHRQRHRAAWRRGMWGSLALVAAAQVGIDFVYPAIDQWAHGAGLVVGGLFGAVLSPHARWARAGHQLARALGVAFIGLAAVAAIQIVRTPVAASLAAPARTRFAFGGVSVTAPVTWQHTNTQVYDSDGIIVMTVEISPRNDDLTGQIAAWIAQEPTRAHDQHFDQVDVAADRMVALPPAWEGSELAVSAAQPDPIGGRQRYRVIAAGARLGERVVRASVYLPETVARDAPGFVRDLFASIELLYP